MVATGYYRDAAAALALLPLKPVELSEAQQSALERQQRSL